MTARLHDVDLSARRVIRAAGDELSRSLGGVEKLDRELVASLYLQVRQTLTDSARRDEKELVEELALSVYLTAAAWDIPGDSRIQILGSLQSAIGAALRVPERHDQDE